MPSKRKTKVRNPFTVAASKRRAGPMRDRRKRKPKEQKRKELKERIQESES